MTEIKREAKARSLRRKASVRNQSRMVKRALKKDIKSSLEPRKVKEAKEEIKDIDLFLNRGKK
jgi:hypothetical protein